MSPDSPSGNTYSVPRYSESALYYVDHRYYDSCHGRWITPDPIGTADNFNLYGYVGNDPLNWRDPSGLYGWTDFTNDVEFEWNQLKSLPQAIYHDPSAYLQDVLNGLGPMGGEFGGVLSSFPRLVKTTWNVAKSTGRVCERDAGTPSSTPTGGSGSRLIVPSRTNSPGTVGGRDYSGHAFDRMQERGIPPSVVENTIENGIPASGRYPGTTVFYDQVNDVTVVTDTSSGRVVTAHLGTP